MAGESERELLEKAIKRRVELSQEAAALDHFITTYTRLLKRLDTESSDQPDLYQGQTRRSIRAAQTAEMMETARRIIIAEKRPMKRGELVERLAAHGYEITGKDKNKVFGTNIWRSGKFRTVGDQGYWPKDVAFPK